MALLDRNIISNSIKKTLRLLLTRDIDIRIRELLDIRNNKNYYKLCLDDFQNNQIYTQELEAIEQVIKANEKALEKYFTADDLYELRLRFTKRAKLWYELRREGIEEFDLEDINRLRELETEPIVRGKLDMFLHLKDKHKLKDLNKDLNEEGYNNIKREEYNADSIERYLVLYETNKAIEEYQYNDDTAITPVIVLPENDNVKAKKTERER